MEATVKQQELDQMLRFQQIRQLSSQEQTNKEQTFNRSYYRKPIKNTYSDSQQSDSSIESTKKGTTPLPPKPAKAKSVLQQAQEEIRWTKEDTSEIDLLAKLQGNGMKDKKIRELANKFKTLNISYEKERTIRKNLEQQLNAVMKANQEAKKSQEDTKLSLEKTSSQKEQVKCSNCGEQEKKIMDFRLKMQNLKTELNKAHRLISKEIGENVDIDQALSQENGWKGRQQKIDKLRGRVKQLQEKLASNGVNVSHMSGFTQLSSAQQTKNNEFSSTQRTSSLADNKRKQLENLKVQVQALRNENDLLQGKVKSLASRKITLQSQLKELKNDYEKKKQIFVEKSDNDDRFISLLKQENEKLKKDERVVTKVVYKQAKENTEEVEALKKEVETLRKKMKELQRTNIELTNQQQLQQQQAKEQKSVKSINQVRQISADRRKQLQDEYLKGNKYLKKLSVQDEQQIYKAWKQTKTKI